MPDWYLNRALSNFRSAVNAAYSARDKTSDGTIGDPAHAARTSDHNPDTDGSVDAWDMDVHLRSGDDDAAIEHLKRIFQAHPSSKYWIHDDQIARREYGWRRDSYSYAGPNRNRHTQHVHWNTRESHEDSTAPWILEDDMTPEQAKQLGDVHHVVTQVPAPDGSGTRVPLHAWCAAIDAALDKLADASGLSSDELNEVKAAAAAGAASALSPQALADAIPDELAREVADLLHARLAA